MPRKCKVCGNKKTAQMEQDFIAGIAKTSIARKYGVPSQSVDYHMDHHLPDKLVRHVDKKEREHTQDLFANIQSALDEANLILQEARDNKQNRLSLDAIKTILSANELFAKMIAKTKEFESNEQEKTDYETEQYVQKGLKALSDAELKAYIQLRGKIAMADDDYELDPSSRYIVNAMGSIQADKRSNSNQENVSESPRTRPTENRNTQKGGLTHSPDEPDTEFEDLDDWDDFNLDGLDLSNDIPSEKDDPAWLRKERRKNMMDGTSGPM